MRDDVTQRNRASGRCLDFLWLGHSKILFRCDCDESRNRHDDVDNIRESVASAPVFLEVPFSARAYRDQKRQIFDRDQNINSRQICHDQRSARCAKTSLAVDVVADENIDPYSHKAVERNH